MIPTVLIVPLLLGQAAAAPASKPLKVALEELSRKADIYAVAVTPLEGLEVSPPPIDEVTKENVEEKLLAMVKRLPIPGRLIRLNLPKTQHKWTAEELLSYARAESELLRKKVGELKVDAVEILGNFVPVDKAKPVMETLGLRPTYVVVTAKANFSGTWETTYGTMWLEQKGTRVTGTYTTNDGTINGEIEGEDLRFVWFERANGTGGRALVRLAPDGMSFSGPWYTHGNADSPSGTWTGKRIGNLTKQPGSNFPGGG